MSGTLPTATSPEVVRRNFMALRREAADASTALAAETAARIAADSALDARVTTAEADIVALETYRIYAPPAGVLDVDNGTLVWDDSGNQVMTEGYP